MIEFVSGDLLEADAQAYVNTVNCVGVMGKGIALQFKRRFPENFRAYRIVCDNKQLRPGMVLVHSLGFKYDYRPQYIVNFPTKDHWRGKSKLEWIDSGLADLIQQVKQREITSIAVPALGCSHGGLNWEDVRPLIVAAFEPLDEVHVLVYEPRSMSRA